jgi:hypothetical protein
VVCIASVPSSGASLKIPSHSDQNNPPAAAQAPQNQLTPSVVNQDETGSLPECYADGAGDYKELNSSICPPSSTSQIVTPQATSSLDGTEEIDEANSTVPLLSPSSYAAVQPNSSLDDNPRTEQARGSNNTTEKAEQSRGGYNKVEKVKQTRGGYNTVEKVEQSRVGYNSTDKPGDNPES